MAEDEDKGKNEEEESSAEMMDASVSVTALLGVGCWKGRSSTLAPSQEDLPVRTPGLAAILKTAQKQRCNGLCNTRTCD